MRLRGAGWREGRRTERRVAASLAAGRWGRSGFLRCLVSQREALSAAREPRRLLSPHTGPAESRKSGELRAARLGGGRGLGGGKGTRVRVPAQPRPDCLTLAKRLRLSRPQFTFLCHERWLRWFLMLCRGRCRQGEVRASAPAGEVAEGGAHTHRCVSSRLCFLFVGPALLPGSRPLRLSLGLPAAHCGVPCSAEEGPGP